MINQGCYHGFVDSLIRSVMLDLNTRITFSFQNYSREKSLLAYLLVPVFVERKQTLLLVLLNSSNNQFLQWIMVLI